MEFPHQLRRQQLRELIANGESTTVEFKRKFTSADKFVRELIAMANTAGGYLLVGVDDDGKVVGIDSEKEVESQIYAAMQSVVPTLPIMMEVVEIEWKDVLVLRIPKSSLKPHRQIGDDPNERPHERKAYIRTGEHSVQASKEMARILALQNPEAPALVVTIGDRERRLFSYMERYGSVRIPDFAKLVNISRRRAAQILVKLVRAGVIQIHHDAGGDFYTLS
jgi:predicted HTH transcriptional regulator